MSGSLIVDPNDVLVCLPLVVVNLFLQRDLLAYLKKYKLIYFLSYFYSVFLLKFLIFFIFRVAEGHPCMITLYVYIVDEKKNYMFLLMS